MEKRGSSGFPLQGESWMPQEEMLEVEKKEKQLKIGIPSEHHEIENRVPLTPEAVEILTGYGHEVWVEKDAGKASNYTDINYSERGAIICEKRQEVFASADLMLKISPPSVEEIGWMKEGAMLISSFQVFTHCRESYIRKLMQKKLTAISFESIQDEHECYPVVRSMSSIAGTASILLAAELLSKQHDGKGVMLGGVSGISPTEVVIMGAGTVAEYAVRAAMGVGSEVKVFDQSLHRLRRLQSAVGHMIPTSIFHPKVMLKALRSADVVIGAVRREEGEQGFFVTEEMVTQMKKGSVIIDLSIDRGGSVETSELRTQSDPMFVKHGVLHYCVPNLPSRVARTASIALSNVFLPLVIKMGGPGEIGKHLKEEVGIRGGVYTYKGILTSRIVGERLGIPSRDIDLLMAAF